MEEGVDKVARDENLGRQETENSKQTKAVSPVQMNGTGAFWQ